MSDTTPATDANGAPLDTWENESPAPSPDPAAAELVPPAEPPELVPAAPVAEAPAPSAPAPSGDTRRLALAGPVWVTEFNYPQEQGDTIVVTRSGVDVPSALADQIKTSASLSGVSVTEVE